MKLTEKEVEELRNLLCSWEDSNISDYEYCNAVGDILNLGNWTWKGANEEIKKEKAGGVKQDD